MNRTNPKVDAYIESAETWQQEFRTLREIALDCQLQEELKWGKPCYTYRDSNVLIVQGFKGSCALLFCKGSLLKDPKGILEKPGENTQGARRIRFSNVAEIAAVEPTLKAYIREAIEAEKAGLEVSFKKTLEPIPIELKSRLNKDPALKKAFAALTPGRRRGYILHFSAPKQSQTRDSRIEKCVPLILKGRGLHDRDSSGASKSPKLAVRSKAGENVVLLSGGNPQIAKGDGDGPVQAYIAAMPGWKSDLGKRLDALIVRNVPNVRKAVRWNSPFYGVEGKGWFLSFHVLTRYVKVTFFAGLSLRPIPPGGTERSKDARWIDIYEDDPRDEAKMASWVKQAAALPGWIP